MPYITQDKRNLLDPKIDDLAKEAMKTNPEHIEGILNYCITKLILQCMQTVKYSEINKMVGALECCKLEFYQRLAIPYEMMKANENGDVYVTPEKPRFLGEKRIDKIVPSRFPKRMYAIGTETSPGDFGMHHGPCPDVNDMLEVTGHDNDVILELTGETSIPLYRWDEETADGWV